GAAQLPHFLFRQFELSFCHPLVLLHLGMFSEVHYHHKFLNLEPVFYYWQGWGVDWTLAALIYLDRQHGTNRAEPFIGQNGLWHQFVEQGIERLLKSEKHVELQREYPNATLNTRKQWFDRWQLELTQAKLEAWLYLLMNTLTSIPNDYHPLAAKIVVRNSMRSSVVMGRAQQ
ncbi:MAG: hypothetical protein DPW16_10715, partial [Chloroflexi bacterium]|nr:hypothetical protein [Chloroflexota bacterium]